MSKHSLALFLLFAGLMLSTNHSFSVPAFPDPIEFKQPDGEIITIQLRGDEKINWAETLDGYTILVNSKGEYQYGIHDQNGDLVFSGIPVFDRNRRTPAENSFLKNTEKALFFSDEQVQTLLSVWDIRGKHSQKSFPATGEHNMLCILMQTPDRMFTKTKEDFEALLNQLNYTVDGATGSFREFHLENSYGQLDVTVDVVGPFTAEHDMPHYASFEGARDLAREGVIMAAQEHDLSQYDISGDGYIDALYMIFSGHGQETGATEAIWSHAWAIWPAQAVDGVLAYSYACSPELRGNSGTDISRIGVIAHEFGHSMGAPDYYDTNGDTGGQFAGTGRWDAMAGGVWNNGGATPAHHNAYTKAYTFQWAESILLEEPQSVTLNNTAEFNDSFYRINTATENEFFLLEKRYRHLFDSHLPGDGMIIYRVHKDVLSSFANNSVNTTHPQGMYPVSANATSDPASSPASYGDINAASCAWPGEGNKIHFSDITLPSSKSWAGENTGKPITHIAVNDEDKTVSFNFMMDEASYDLALIASPQEGGVLSGEGSYPPGEQVSITATPNPGYKFIKWERSNGHTMSSQPSATFTMGQENTTLTAVFEMSTSVSEPFSQLRVYPNPFDANINIVHVSELKSISIKNLLGQEKRRVTHIQDTYKSISTETLSKGIYLMVLEDMEGNISIHKITKQ